MRVSYEVVVSAAAERQRRELPAFAREQTLGALTRLPITSPPAGSRSLTGRRGTDRSDLRH